MYSVNILSIEFKCSFEYQLMTELTIGEVLSVYDLISVRRGARGFYMLQALIS